MTTLQRAMIAEARLRYGAVRPCGTKRTLSECFTHESSYGLILWFNDAGGGTHVLRGPMSTEPWSLEQVGRLAGLRTGSGAMTGAVMSTAGGAGSSSFPAPPPLPTDAEVEALR